MYTRPILDTRDPLHDLLHSFAKNRLEMKSSRFKTPNLLHNTGTENSVELYFGRTIVWFSRVAMKQEVNRQIGRWIIYKMKYHALQKNAFSRQCTIPWYIHLNWTILAKKWPNLFRIKFDLNQIFFISPNDGFLIVYWVESHVAIFFLVFLFDWLYTQSMVKLESFYYFLRCIHLS